MCDPPITVATPQECAHKHAAVNGLDAPIYNEWNIARTYGNTYIIYTLDKYSGTLYPRSGRATGSNICVTPCTYVRSTPPYVYPSNPHTILIIINTPANSEGGRGPLLHTTPHNTHNIPTHCAHLFEHDLLHVWLEVLWECGKRLLTPTHTRASAHPRFGCAGDVGGCDLEVYICEVVKLCCVVVRRACFLRLCYFCQRLGLGNCCTHVQFLVIRVIAYLCTRVRHMRDNGLTRYV